MEKLQYLVWLAPGTTRPEVRSLMVEEVAPRLLAEAVHGLTLDLDDDGAEVAAPLPAPEGEHTPEALVSLWVDCYDRRAPLERILGEVAVDLHGYQVLESLYSDYGDSPWGPPRTWPDGTRSPGILTVATFEQLPGTDFEEWLAFWHGRQSPMSEALQPRCRYVRNLVVRALDPGAPPWRGIVEEAWPSPEDVTDPMRFYCAGQDRAVMERNVATMLDHVTRLMDLRTMRSTTMSEWIMRTLGS
ncbi:MAG TPA: hypothetical protein VMB72_15230 [Acidimicrobiales bacterium]|nr:hypothetical protein [Acidimicrobiales bacterium]